MGRPMARTRMLTPLIDGLDNSISNAVVLAKSIVSFSSACCTGAVGIALMALRYLQCENSRGQTTLTDQPSLRMRAEG